MKQNGLREPLRSESLRHDLSRQVELLEQQLAEVTAALEREKCLSWRYYLELKDLRSRSFEARLKRVLDALLNGMQRLVPESVRRGLRPFYLEQIYFRIYPERRPLDAAPSAVAVAESEPEAINFGSSYGPYNEFKRRLHSGLPPECGEIACGEVPGVVSVVLPVYNGARYIAKAIESVLAQTYSNLELIVVNDGSTDATPRIVARYENDHRVRVIHQPNRKLPAALNAGFAHCSGEFWTWTSADNIMLPEMLDELTGFLRRRPDVQTVYANQEIIDDLGRPALHSHFCPGYQNPPGSELICWPRDPGQLSFVQNNYVGGCFLYRAWAAKLAGPYGESSFGYEDYDFWMRMNDLFRVAHFGEQRPLYRYRLHNESLSARDKELRITERVRNFMPFEHERRAFFARPFDVSFFGSHPWFGALAEAYRKGGHNVFEAAIFNGECRYRYGATRAFDKRVAIFGEEPDPGALELARETGCLIVQLADEPRIQPDLCFSGRDDKPQPGVFAAASAMEAGYALLAGANSLAHARNFPYPETLANASRGSHALA